MADDPQHAHESDEDAADYIRMALASVSWWNIHGDHDGKTFHPAEKKHCRTTVCGCGASIVEEI